MDMQAIDTKGLLGLLILDPKRKIPKAHLASVCKLHQGEKTCKYLILGANASQGVSGFVCVKNSKMRPVLDKHAAEGKMTAQGDNCEGINASVSPEPSPRSS